MLQSALDGIHTAALLGMAVLTVTMPLSFLAALLLVVGGVR